MSHLSKPRLFSTLAVLAILVTALCQASPVSAENGGTANYTVQSGDTLKEIADQYGLTVERILETNTNIKDPNLILVGQTIVLPTGRNEGVSATQSKHIYVWQREKDGGRVERSERLYLVKGGDNLTAIAKSYGITLEKLLDANPQFFDSSALLRGELVYIPNGIGEIVPPFYQTPAVASK